MQDQELELLQKYAMCLAVLAGENTDVQLAMFDAVIGWAYNHEFPPGMKLCCCFFPSWGE